MDEEDENNHQQQQQQQQAVWAEYVDGMWQPMPAGAGADAGAAAAAGADAAQPNDAGGDLLAAAAAAAAALGGTVGDTGAAAAAAAAVASPAATPGSQAGGQPGTGGGGASAAQVGGVFFGSISSDLGSCVMSCTTYEDQKHNEVKLGTTEEKQFVYADVRFWIADAKWGVFFGIKCVCRLRFSLCWKSKHSMAPLVSRS